MKIIVRYRIKLKWWVKPLSIFALIFGPLGSSIIKWAVEKGADIEFGDEVND